MKMLKISTILMGLALFGFAGCGSSDTTEGTPDAGGLGNQDAGPTLYGITPGAYCYKVTSIVPGYIDGCENGAAEAVGKTIPGSYDNTTGILTLGTKGSMGGGEIKYNQGTLIRTKSLSSAPEVPGCSWNQADTTTVTVTDTNKLTVSVVESQDTITAACGASATTCTSTWTWTMEVATPQVDGVCL
jgi:hypothetical protein